VRRFPIVGAIFAGLGIVIYLLGPFQSTNRTDEGANTHESTVPVSLQLIESHTRFAFDLFRGVLRETGPDKNVLICPPSVALTLSKTYNGASGKTRDAIGKVLNVNGMMTDILNKENQNLLSNLNGLGKGAQMTVTNALWGSKNITFDTRFLDRCKKSYGADITSLDFNTGAVDTINDWVKDKTNGKITRIIDSLDPEDILFLTNTAYFKGEWTDKFDKASTEEQPFVLADGTKKNVPTMNKSDMEVESYHGDIFEAVSIPYGKGRVRMYIFLPNQGSNLQAFYKKLNAVNWRKWMADFEKDEVMIYLPRFKTSYGIQLDDTLKNLGMKPAFDLEQADFSAMSSTSAWINTIKHKAYIDVNEEGTEAAAATEEEMTAGIAMPFMVNRPFFFTIYDERTGEILFMGSIADPTDQGI
jgi:serpin B